MRNRILFFILTGATLLLMACEKEDSYPLTPFFYPEAFTPNGDFLNDDWGPIGVFSTDIDTNYAWLVGFNHDTYEMKIRSKNGRQLFYSEDINLRWDGTYKSDTCAAGFYYYLVRYESLEGVKYKDEGVLELIR